MEKRIQNMNAENRTARYLKYLCEHGKYKYQCKDCGGAQICPHNRQKAHCKECKGSQICSHKRAKYQCKKCSDPVKVNIEQWIFNSRQYDKMRNIYDADRFIDKCFLKGLISIIHFSLQTTNNVITKIAKSTSNIQNIEMILRQSRDLIIRLAISRATVFCAA